MKKLMLATVVCLAMAGCTTPYWSKHFGDAKAQAQASQTLNPTPASLPPATTEGQIMNASQDRYHNSYGKPQAPSNVYKIGVGTGTSTR
ncbi:MAG TPA: hypothetical protein VFM34_05880 [Moraxellaceae bacterium]|nr:hypothetical protein [Moraxellaceae bacterium]